MQIPPITQDVQSINKFKMQNSALICLFIYLFVYLFPPVATAEGASLSISPSLLQVETIPPATPKAPLTLENKGDEAINIQIIFKPFQPSKKEDGQIQYLNDSETTEAYKKIFSKIQLIDDGIVTTHFELGPQQKKNLQLQFTIPKDESTADYYFSIIFLASTNGLTPQSPTSSGEMGQTQDQNISTINAGIAANVLLSIGQSDPQGYIEKFSAPTFLQSGPVDFTIRIKNAGPHVITPKGIIFIKNIFGQTIGRVDLAPANILAGTTRTLTDALTDSQLSPHKTRWNEKFLLGPYTATLNLAVSDKGPIYNQSIVFLALPIQLIIAIILAILITIGIILRVRYRLRTDK
jgi:hypothetical protein